MRLTGLMAVLMLLAAAPAWADQLVVTAQAAGAVGGDPYYTGPITHTAALAQFDPALGTLDSVEFSVDAWHRGTFSFKNNSPTGNARVKVDWVDYSFEVNAFGGTGGNIIFEPWVTPPTPQEPFGGPPGHWNLPLTPWIPPGGTVGPLPFGTDRTFSYTYLPTDPELASFVGMGTLPIEIVDWAVFSVTTYGAQTWWKLDSECGVYVKATYNYTVPEPTALALLSLAGLLALRRRR